MRHAAPAADDRFSDRPLDLLFVGAPTERRRRFFAQSGLVLSRFTCCLHLPEGGLQRAGVPTALNPAAAIGLAQRSKILLHVHESDVPTFPWQHIVHLGIWQRALVVTEPCAPVPGLRAGEHYLACRLSELPDLLTWLLSTGPGAAQAEAIRRRAFAALVREYDLTAWLRSLLPAVLNAVAP
ncbi:MAG TPA: hypothetical protein VKV26_22285 [Dehalococcoidia bacterium]|nr:hypothetical protein [Dehalococcoidia bacterium]